MTPTLLNVPPAAVHDQGINISHPLMKALAQKHLGGQGRAFNEPSLFSTWRIMFPGGTAVR